jgi:hypothetical protein
VLTCKQVTERASRYIDADLGCTERAGIRMHLAMCGACSRYLQQMRTTLGLLPAAAITTTSEAADEQAAELVMARLMAAGAAPRPALLADTAAISAPAPRIAAARVPRVLVDALLIGVVGLLTWEVFARGLAPFWLGFALDPRTLIDAALDITGGGAVVVHLCTGLLLFPFAFLLIARPVARILAPHLPWWGVAAVFGLVLWIFAGYVVGSVIGGMPAFFGFGAVAWASLIGHAALALSMGATAQYRSSRHRCDSASRA